jgi:alkaline phosphatase D
MQINRRRALALFGLSAAAPVAAQAQTSKVAFNHGVAAGDPLADRMILWTRVTTDKAAKPQVAWQVAEDAAFKRVVAKGSVTAEAASDHTVKVDAAGLKPGRDYWYRFTTGGVISPVGQARTLPVGATPDVVLAVVSCSLYAGGLFNAYDAVARLSRVDAVLHLGDYIYEYGAGPADYGMDAGAKIGRAPDPAHEIVTLDDYRRRHACYKADADLQAAHARAAWICVWDDHETANDSWIGGAENHQPNEGDWATRKAAALKAYFEWMPIRRPSGPMAEAIQRSFDFGNLATLIMVETRLQGRSQQLSFGKDLAMVAGPDGKPAPDIQGFLAKLNAPGRTLLDPAQEAWVGKELKRSVGGGRPWQVIGNQVVMGRVFGPDLEAMAGAQNWAKILADLPEDVRGQVAQAAALFKLGLPMNLDAWDGYPAARERLYNLFKAAGANPIVLAGDSHAFWVNDLKDANGKLVATEIGTTSITSPSTGDLAPGLPLGLAIAARNDEVLFNDQASKGFALLTLTPKAAKTELVAVSTILAKPYTTKVVMTVETASQPGALVPTRLL